MINHKISFGKAFGMILGSVLIVSGLSTALFFFFNHIKDKRMRDEKFRIVAIAQTSSEAESLKTVYLAELLDLSIDRPRGFYQFDIGKGQQKLLSSSLIKSAKLKKIPPGTIYVDYDLRKPIAFLGDFSNTAIDAEGYLFPFKPFFTPKKLPEIYVGLTGFGEEASDTDGDCGKWGCRLHGHRAELALQVYHLAMKHCCNENTQLLKIDTSKAYALSYGQRQIIVILEDRSMIEKNGKTVLYISPKILRLSTQGYRQELANFLVLNKKLQEQAKVTVSTENNIVHAPQAIIDLRVPHLAFIKDEV